MPRRRKYDYELADRLAAAHGVKRQTVIKAWRDGRSYESPSLLARTSRRSAGISLSLAVMAHLSDYGEVWTRQAIGEVCGCEREAIRYIEKRALKKLRKLGALRRELS
jgi:hypothetical protein